MFAHTLQLVMSMIPAMACSYVWLGEVAMRIRKQRLLAILRSPPLVCNALIWLYGTLGDGRNAIHIIGVQLPHPVEMQTASSLFKQVSKMYNYVLSVRRFQLYTDQIILPIVSPQLASG